MWTHRHPYRSFELTPEYIQERGQLALSRALNVRRVIGFVGSGATAAYGRPSWRALVETAVKVANPSGEKTGQDPVVDALAAAIGQFGEIKDANADDLVVLLALAENLARKKNLTAEFRREIAAQLVQSRETALKEVNENLKWPKGIVFRIRSRAEPIQTMLRELKVCRFLTLNYDVEIERELENHFRTSGGRQKRRETAPLSEFEQLASGQNAATSKCFADAILEARSIKNENKAVEKFISVLKKNRQHQHIVEILEDGLERFRRGTKFEDVVSYEDGLGKSVLSVTLGPDNVGDLVNFSLYSREYGAQVFHLHGRYDQPEHMVLTEKDYQNTYLRSGESKETFDEALSAVFDGNDVLFVGVGMQEADMMRPLRQFVSQDRSPDFSRRHVYTLMERKCSLRKPREPVTGDEFFETHFLEDQGMGRKDLQSDTAQSLKLNTQFGIFTLYYGDEKIPGFEYPILRFLRLGCKVFEHVVTKTDNDVNLRPVLKKFEIELGHLLKLSAKLDDEHDIPRALLRKEELRQLISAFKRAGNKLGDKAGTKSKDKPKAFIDALENEVRARALDRALYDLSEKRRLWWEDWRLTPAERSARFSKEYAEQDTDKKYPNMARHRPAYEPWLIRGPDDKQKLVSPQEENINDLGVLRKLRALAAKVVGEAPTADCNSYPSALPGASEYGRRIVRLSMSRGAGKGSLLHLLRQNICSDDPRKNRFVLDTLFDRSDQTGRPGEVFRYHGSFMLHLSFSMEFASVIDALRLFFEDALAGLVKERGPVAAEALLKLITEWDDKSLPGHEEPDEIGLLRTIFDAYVEKRQQSFGQQIKHFREGIDAQEPFRRGHRLDQLRSAMDAFQILAARIDPQLRVCVVMSGLDKLCNAKGDAYNPMYRAFFRLLSGEGCKLEHESNPLLPMDLVLISGNPGVPVRYLSTESSKKDVLKKMEEKGLSYSPGSEWKPYHGGELMLQAWPELPAIRIEERYWFQTSDCKSAFAQALTEDGPERERKRKRKSAKLKDPRKEKGEHASSEEKALSGRATIKNVLAKNVALSSWCAGAFEVFAYADSDTHLQKARQFLKQLDDAADRAGTAGIIGHVLETHRRSWFKNGFLDGTQRNQANACAELANAILSHLSLFPMPVEARVLYGCDEIYSLLHRLVDEQSGPANTGPKVRTEKPGGIRRKRRRDCLNLLFNILEKLAKTHLIIKVMPKPVDLRSEPPEDWAKVHTRYTIQHQLRDYVGHQMDLFVPDQGERNFFQLSLYCDQPRDLPTPTEAHYRMIRQLMERQIKQCRSTLWCLYQWQPSPDQTANSTRSTKLAYSGMLRRLRSDFHEDDQDTLDLTLASFHALTQRIRALYGLMRGGFSIGAISRLPGLQDEQNPDQPFVRFRGWLRGLTNAAVAMKHLEGKLNELSAKHKRGEMGEEEGQHRIHHSVDLASLRPEPDDPTSLGCDHFPPHRIAQPLYRDEIGWLLNERGLIAFVQGQLFDAIPLFERAAQVMRHRESSQNTDPALNAAVRRVKLNHAIAMIERGNMFKAREMIESLLLPAVGSLHPGSQVSWIGEGYLGLIRHLAGDLSIAEDHYLRLIEKANDQEMPRLVSIFNRHLADLYANQGEFEKARTAVHHAVGAALQSEQRDILWYCRLSELRITLAENSFSSEENGRTLEGALEYARTMGLNKLEIAALNAQAQVMLKQGERVLAGRIAAQSAALANRCGLRLLKIAALTVYGEALIMRQQYHLAQKILSEAHRESERRGYQNRSGQISVLLEKIPSFATEN